jgi:hypothetical protein
MSLTGPGARAPRLLVTGSRGWTNDATIHSAIDTWLLAAGTYLPVQPVLVHGAAIGADTIAAEYWISLGFDDEPHPPNYYRYNTKQAPIVRNAQMVQLGADWCLAFMLNESSGTTHCVKLCKAAGIPTTIYKERKCQPIASVQSKSKHANTTQKSTPTTPPTYSPGAEPKPS